MSISIFCISANEFQAETIVVELWNAGFPDSDIAVLFPESSGKGFAQKQRNKAPQGALIGSAALGIAGGVFGLLAGMGLVVKSGLNSFVLAGPLVAALGGIAVGLVAGAIIGAWIGMGIPECVAERFEGNIESGNILISVHAADRVRARLAQAIFTEAEAQDIAMTGEAEVPEKRVLAKRAEVHAVA